VRGRPIVETIRGEREREKNDEREWVYQLYGVCVVALVRCDVSESTSYRIHLPLTAIHRFHRTMCTWGVYANTTAIAATATARGDKIARIAPLTDAPEAPPVDDNV